MLTIWFSFQRSVSWQRPWPCSTVVRAQSENGRDLQRVNWGDAVNFAIQRWEEEEICPVCGSFQTGAAIMRPEILHIPTNYWTVFLKVSVWAFVSSRSSEIPTTQLRESDGALFVFSGVFCLFFFVSLCSCDRCSPLLPFQHIWSNTELKD